jgi:adenylate cyclase, class 2
MTDQPRSNIEVKARYPDLSRAREVCHRLNAHFEGILNQTDTYFATTRGRLKLRQINNEQAELILYVRPNEASARKSLYTVTPVADAKLELERLGTESKLLCTVRKRRELYLWHNVRIHLDEVDGLGNFIELEGVVSPQADEQISRQHVDRLVAEFNITDANQLGVSYSDLLMAR